MPRPPLPVDLPRMLLARLAVAVLPLLFLFLLLGFTAIAHRWREIPVQEARSLGLAMVRSLALNGAHARSSHDDSRLEPLARSAAALPGVKSVVFTDADSRLLVCAGVLPSPAAITKASRAVVTSRRDDEGAAPAEGEDFLQVAAPMQARLGTLGAVVVRMDLATWRKTTSAATQRILGVGLLVAALAVAVTFVLLRRLVSPAREVAEAAVRLAAGDLSVRVDPLPQHELGRLGGALNRMATRLGERLEAERRARRELDERIRRLAQDGPEAPQGTAGREEAASGDEMGRLESAFADLAGLIRSSREGEQTLQRDVAANRLTLGAAHDRLLEQDLVKSDFLNIVSHELRTPLTSIKAFTEILLEATPDDPPPRRAQQREFLDIIDQEAERLTRLIGDLLDLSRIEEGEIAWRMVRLPLDIVVEGAARSCQANADRKGVTIDVRFPRDLVVRGDRDRLLQMMTSLFRHALDSTPAGGSVHVRGMGEGSEVCVELQVLGNPASDSLPDEPPERTRLPREEFRVDTFGGRVSRTGVGLSIVESIAAAHKGRLEARSEDSAGSMFRIRLPRSLLPSPPPLPETEGEGGGTSRAGPAVP